jgi:hypothetical protein
MYSSFKQRARAFQRHKLKSFNRSEEFRRSMFCWDLLIKLFTPYYNHLGLGNLGYRAQYVKLPDPTT